MTYPAFFDAVPTLTLHDPLADLLGAVSDGLMTYGYTDAVKLAGHSCPTVAGAYLMTLKALGRLYPDGPPGTRRDSRRTAVRAGGRGGRRHRQRGQPAHRRGGRRRLQGIGRPLQPSEPAAVCGRN